MELQNLFECFCWVKIALKSNLIIATLNIELHLQKGRFNRLELIFDALKREALMLILRWASTYHVNLDKSHHDSLKDVQGVAKTKFGALGNPEQQIGHSITHRKYESTLLWCDWGWIEAGLVGWPIGWWLKSGCQWQNIIMLGGDGLWEEITGLRRGLYHWIPRFTPSLSLWNSESSPITTNYKLDDFIGFHENIQYCSWLQDNGIDLNLENSRTLIWKIWFDGLD